MKKFFALVWLLICNMLMPGKFFTDKDREYELQEEGGGFIEFLLFVAFLLGLYLLFAAIFGWWPFQNAGW